MATAYVSTSGGAAYPGTVASPTSLALALANAAAGDVIYIAPGNYLNASSLNYTGATGTSGSQVSFIGDPTGTFTSSTAGPVRLTPVANIATGTTNNVLTITNKDYINFSNIVFENASSRSTLLTLDGCTYITFTKCVFIGSIGTSNNGPTKPLSHTWSKCVFIAGRPIISFSVGSHTSAYNNPFVIEDCLIFPLLTSGIIRCIELGTGHVNAGGGNIRNCTFFGGDYGVNWFGAYSTSNPLVVTNCLFLFFGTALHSDATANKVIGNYNRLTTAILSNTTSTNSTTGGLSGVDLFDSLLTGINNLQPFTSTLLSANASFGTAIGAPATDIYGVTWTASSPDAGSGTYRVITNNPTNIGYSGGIERNASAITIAPGETSRSLYLYLGATGITHTTTNLTASYTRNGQASVPITLVAQTPTGSYISGGFCEVSAPYARGTYRLDVPNAAFDFGADDVTIFVGGANTTNGAVVTCNMQGIAGNIVHIGPFKVIADGLGSDQPLDIVQGVQAPVSVQLVDANENGVDISGATVEAKVYNAIGSLIATYSCVPVYAADGRCTFQLTTLVTNTAGVYNVTLTRTIGGNIVVFGPMKMIVRAN